MRIFALLKNKSNIPLTFSEIYHNKFDIEFLMIELDSLFKVLFIIDTINKTVSMKNMNTNVLTEMKPKVDINNPIIYCRRRNKMNMATGEIQSGYVIGLESLVNKSKSYFLVFENTIEYKEEKLND